MERIKYEQKVWDLEQKELVLYGTLLKRLGERQGLGRNEWHEKASKLANRNLGPPNKLSDIFNNTRKLPLRDIYPYIAALGLSLETQEHYVCEYLKALLDPSLSQYIGVSNRDEIFDQMKERLSKIEDLYTFEFNRASYLEYSLIPELKEKFEIKLCNYHGQLFLDNEEEPNQAIYIHYLLFKDMLSELEGMISEIYNETASKKARKFLDAIMPHDYIEQLKSFGKSIGEDVYHKEWIKHLPKVNSIEKSEVNFLILWLSSSAQRRELFLQLINYIDSSRESVKNYFKGLLITKVHNHFATHIKEFKRCYPMTFTFLVKYDANFKSLIHKKINIDPGYYEIKKSILHTGGVKSGFFKSNRKARKLDLGYRKRILSCYLNYVYLAYQTEVNIDNIKLSKKKEYRKTVDNLISDGLSFNEILLELEEKIKKIKDVPGTLSKMEEASKSMLESISEIYNILEGKEEHNSFFKSLELI